jgi:hypothetical protein
MSRIESPARVRAAAPFSGTSRVLSAATPVVRPQVRAFVRNGLIVYFLMVLLEGTFRKWLLPDFNQYIYVAKDAVLAFLCLRVVLTFGRVPAPAWLRESSIGQVFAVFTVFSFCEGFNFHLPNTLLGIWGIRTYVLPMSLVYLIPIGFPDPFANERYFRKYLLLGIPIALLCMAQYQLPPSHVLNRYANSDFTDAVALVVDAVRVTGPFSYISGLASYLLFSVAGLLGVLFASRWSIRGNLLIWICLLMSVGVIPMTGSRAIAAYSILYVLITVALAPLLRQGGSASSRLFVAFIAIVSVSISFYGEAFDRLAERARTSYDTHTRFYNLVFQPAEFADEAGLFGFGAASTHQAAGVLVPGGASYYWLPRVYFEDEAGRVMLELGSIGFLLYLCVKVGVCLAVYQYIRQYGFAVPLAIPVACLLTTASGMLYQMLFNSVGSSFYWGMFGLFVAQANATRMRLKQR